MQRPILASLIFGFAALLICDPQSATAKPPEQPLEASNVLREYVNRPDSSFGWKVRRRGTVGTANYAELILTSQVWRDIVWKHQLFVFLPADVQQSSQALLLIDGGSWSDKLEADVSPAEPLPEKVRLFATLADVLHAPVAVVRQIPEQPILDGRKEDQIIAFTLDKYLQTGESDWPLMLPMVKAAVRAMDAVEKFAHDEWHVDIENFTLTGASKRGWTTWLTAAVDSRVNALAPMVINMLNMVAHEKLQKDSFGDYSEKIRDYTERRLQERLFTEQGATLRAIIDPYAYRKQLQQPKLIILATNDAYWPVDSLNLYWDELEGEKYVLYVPNNGHGIQDYPRVVATVMALQRSLTGGPPLPKLKWNIEEQADRARLELVSDKTPTAVRQWTATSDSRDFRKSEWISKPLPSGGDSDREFVAELEKPSLGFNAMFLEVEFPGEPMAYNLSTTLHVFPSDASGDDRGAGAE